MAFFEDLSPYTYGQPERRELVNVGWLEKGHPFTVGETAQEFRDKLALLCQQGALRRRGQQVVHVTTLGHHRCDFCNPGERSAVSSTELRVRGANRAYAAPVLVHHYVVVHGYHPPPEFIAAVISWNGDIYEE